MQAIAKAVQEGASAYLRSTPTIAFVAVVFFVIGFLGRPGLGMAFGFLIGAVFSAAAGFIGMNVPFGRTCAPRRPRSAVWRRRCASPSRPAR